MSLITLKTFTKISTLSHKLGYNSTKCCIESVVGKISDMADLSDTISLQILTELNKRIEQQKIDKTYKEPAAVSFQPNKGAPIGRNSYAGKPASKKEKKMIYIS